MADLNDLTVFQMTRTNSKYLSERQKVLATNIANANTPKFLPQDVERPNFARELGKVRVAMQTTDSKHIPVLPSQNSTGFRTYTPKPETMSLDGNGVVIEDQMNEVNKTKTEQDRVLTLYGKYRDLIKMGNTRPPT